MRILGYDIGIVEALITANILAFFITWIIPSEVSLFGLQPHCNAYSYKYDEIVPIADWSYCNLALQPSTILPHPWTLLTSMFMHGGFNHLLLNMITLFFFGIYLAGLVGEKDFLKIYFTGGIAGSFLVIFTSLIIGIPNPYEFTIGASGAIFAVGGVLAVLRPNQPVLLFGIIPMRLWVAVIGGFFVLSLFPGISWQGHLGGLLIGLIFGYYLKKKEPLTGYPYGTYGYGYRY